MLTLLGLTLYAPPGEAAPAPADTATGAGGFSGIIIWLLIMVALFYFMIILPQRRRTKNFNEMMSKLKEGDRIVTAGGIVAKVITIKGDSIRIRSGNNAELDVTRRSIAAIIGKGETEDVEPEIGKK